MRKILIFIIASVLMAVAMPTTHVMAQCVESFDFLTGTHGWVAGTADYARWTLGEGWRRGGPNLRIYISATLGYEVTYLKLTFNQAQAGTAVIAGSPSTTFPGKSGTVWELTGFSRPTGGVAVNIYNPAASNTVPTTLRLIKIEVNCDDTPPEEPTELTRPLQPMDRLFAAHSIQTGTITGTVNLANNAVIFGAESGSMVSAVIDGTVTEIEPLTPSLCYELFDPATEPILGDSDGAANGCRVTLVAAFNSSGNYVELFSPTNNPPPAYVIHILGDDGREYLQIATDVDEYVYEGQSVIAGCWLGRALSLANQTASTNTIAAIVSLYAPITGVLIQVFGQNTQPFEALTAVWVFGPSSYVDAFDEFVLEPSDSAPCNTPEGYEGCMGDTRLEDPSAWQSSNGVSWTDPGALLPTNAFISATYNLDGDRDPVAIIGAVAVPLGTLSVSFGTTNSPTNSVLGTTEIEVAAGDPDEGEFFTLKITNVNNTPIRLDFVCVVHDEARGGGPAPRPPVTTTTICYLIDHSFENGLTSWEASEDVEEDDGAARLPDDETIEQELELTAGTYTLRVITEVWGTAAYSPDDENITGGITIEYAYPATSFVSMGTKTWAAYTHRTQTFTAEIVIASDEDGTFTLRPNIASAPTGVLGVAITSACLTKAGEVDGGPGDGLITPTCGTIATPTLSATQPGTWTTWLWAQLNKFYRCELIKVLNQILTVMTNFFRTSLWQVRWSQAAVIRFGNFTSTGLYWLNGHLHNIAVGRVYQIEGSEFESYGDLGDVLLGGLSSIIEVFVDLLQRVIDFIFYLLSLVFQIAFAIVMALIQLAVVLIGLIIGMLGQFFDLINALFFAWNNSTASPVAGLPMCAVEPKEAPVCIILWTLENTIFSGRGFLFIPFMIAYGSAELLLWAIAKFSKSAKDSAEAG
jgi:hypothetical protein